MSSFQLFSITEFEKYISNLKVLRTILFVQQHHTFIPSYIHFKKNNHIALQTSMQNTHINSNGWSDIGQHFSTFPDGKIATGRSLEKTPACIYGNNAHSVCIENVGNFDTGKDDMTEAQKETIVSMTAILCKKFSIPINTNKIVYHHWFNLATGERNNGTHGNKSCPGTAFFGGNKTTDCEKHFLPLVAQQLDSLNPIVKPIPILKYAMVTAKRLKISSKPSSVISTVKESKGIEYGVVLRVYEEINNWYKISSSASNWVYKRRTIAVVKAVVHANVLRVRSGPSKEYPEIDKLLKGQEVFIVKEKNGWCKINLDEKWVSKMYLDFS